MKARLMDWLQAHDTTMLLTLGLGLCVLPFVLLFTVPFVGWALGIPIAALVLLFVTLICYVLCYFPKIAPSQEDKNYATRSSLR